jgi:hypothetical protein
MKMKKFFGLKMTLAALAVVSFASCYDSESGDVIIPNATTIDWPAPQYVVNGVVTDWQTGKVVEGVNVGGVISASTTDANGAYSVTLSSPANGDVEFTKAGYYKTTRTLSMVSMKTGTAVYNLDAVIADLDNPQGALKEVGVTATPDEAKAVVETADDLAAATGIDFVNATDNQQVYDFWAWALSKPLPYGLKAVAAKSLEEDGEVAFLKWFNNTNYYKRGQKTPYDEYTEYTGRLTVIIPAQFKVTKINVTPIKVEKTLIFPLEEGDYEQPVEVYEDYQVTVDGVSLKHDHGHGHGHGTDTNAGGGSGE